MDDGAKKRQSLVVKTATSPKSTDNVAFQNISLLPSPVLPSDSGVFKAYSGHELPPSSTVRRAPSSRLPPGTHPNHPTTPQQNYCVPRWERLHSPLGHNTNMLHSPVHSPVHTDKLHSPMRTDKSHSPVHTDKLHSPVHTDKLHSPLRTDNRLNSPLAHNTTLDTLDTTLPTLDPTSPLADRIFVPRHRAKITQRVPSFQLQRENHDLAILSPSDVCVVKPDLDHGVTFQDKEEVYIAFDKELRRQTYDRIKIIGEGSFSELILAQPSLRYVRESKINQAKKTLVAVKITPLGRQGSPERTQIELALHRDIELATQLSHPSLVSVIAFNIDPLRSLVVLPYYPGGDLFDLVASHRAQFSPQLVRRLFADVTSAIVYLHENLVVHRDIKLENVLVNMEVHQLLALDEPTKAQVPLSIVTDLGLAKKFDPESPLLTTRCGSEDYVAPELLMGRPYDGRQTDSWALGVLLYAMLEGRLPFDRAPNSPAEGPRARAKTAQRIARVSWSWYKHENQTDWDEAKRVVEACLRRNDERVLASELKGWGYVKDALPDLIVDRKIDMDLFKPS